MKINQLHTITYDDVRLFTAEFSKRGPIQFKICFFNNGILMKQKSEIGFNHAIQLANENIIASNKIDLDAKEKKHTLSKMNVFTSKKVMLNSAFGHASNTVQKLIGKR